MQQKNINIQGTTIELIKSPRAKRLNLIVRPSLSPRVSIPKRISFKQAIKFVESNILWIKDKQEKMKTIENGHTIFDSNSLYKLCSRNLIIYHWNCEEIKTNVTRESIEIYCAPDTEITNPDVIQAAIRKALEKIWKRQASVYIPSRVYELAQVHSLRYKSIKIKNLKTRWGSCSADNNLSFNIHLMRLSNELIDYVILHELVHTVQKNHGKYFWETLKKILPNALDLDRDLKKYRTQIY